jgi:hypothetical protein
MTITPQTKSWLRQSAALDGAVVSQTLLNLLERVEALEQRPTCKEFLQVPPTPEAAPVVTDEELWSLWAPILPNSVADALRACYDLGRQHGAAQPPAAQPAPPPAPAGGLVERVEHEVTGQWHQNDREAARAAIREVAAWAGQMGLLRTERKLLDEADR